MAKDDNHLSEQYITFTIGEEDYAISIINVEEIVKNVFKRSMCRICQPIKHKKT